MSADQGRKKELGIPNDADKQARAEEPLRNDPVIAARDFTRRRGNQLIKITSRHSQTIYRIPKKISIIRLAPIRAIGKAAPKNQFQPLGPKVNALTSRSKICSEWKPAAIRWKIQMSGSEKQIGGLRKLTDRPQKRESKPILEYAGARCAKICATPRRIDPDRFNTSGR